MHAQSGHVIGLIVFDIVPSEAMLNLPSGQLQVNFPESTDAVKSKTLPLGAHSASAGLQDAESELDGRNWVEIEPSEETMSAPVGHLQVRSPEPAEAAESKVPPAVWHRSSEASLYFFQKLFAFPI
jgi:hypothetical protein